MESLAKIAERIERHAAKAGFDRPEVNIAATGTIYIEWSLESQDTYPVLIDGEYVDFNETETFKIRVADHSECYCTEDISVDPQGATWRQAVDALVEWQESVLV